MLYYLVSDYFSHYLSSMLDITLYATIYINCLYISNMKPIKYYYINNGDWRTNLNSGNDVNDAV